MSENYRPSEFQGVLANTQLDKVPGQQARREANRQRLDRLLRDHPLVEPIPPRGQATAHGNYAYLLRIRPEVSLSGKRLAIYLETEGIPCHSGYRQLIFDIDYCRAFFSDEARKRYREACPTAVSFTEKTIWLPQTILLGQADDMADVAGALDKIASCLSIEQPSRSLPDQA